MPFLLWILNPIFCLLDITIKKKLFFFRFSLNFLAHLPASRCYKKKPPNVGLPLFSSLLTSPFAPLVLVPMVDITLILTTKMPWLAKALPFLPQPGMLPAKKNQRLLERKWLTKYKLTFCDACLLGSWSFQSDCLGRSLMPSSFFSLIFLTDPDREIDLAQALLLYRY